MNSNIDWRAKMKEMLDANPKENDSLELSDSWKAIPRRTEVLANRSNHHLYRRNKDPPTESLFNPIIVKGSSQQNTERLKQQNTNVSPNANNDTGSAPTSSTPNDVVTEGTSPKTFEETPGLSFTDFLRSNNKTNIQITSTPYVAPGKSGMNQLSTDNKILLSEVRSPKISLARTSFLHRNNDSYETPRSSRVSVNLINNSQLILQNIRDAEREPHNIIPKGNKSSNGAQTGIAIVSSTVQSVVLTSDEDSEEQPIFLKPPENVYVPKSRIVSISSQNTNANKIRSQILALQNEGQLTTDQPLNSSQNAKRTQESHREVGVSTKEYMELMHARASNTQLSENSTASSTRRKLYKKGNSIHEDEGVPSNTVASQKVTDDIFDQLRFEQPVTSHTKGVLPASTRKEKTVPVQSFKEKVDSLDDANEFQSKIMIQPNIGTLSPNKCERRRLRSTHCKSPLNSHQNGSETKEIMQLNTVVNQKQLSKKSEKRAPFSKQSRMHSEPTSSELIGVNPLSTEVIEKQLTKKSQKPPSLHPPVDNEQDDFQPIDVDQPDDEVDVAQISNENKKRTVPPNDLPVESEQDDFETSDIQPCNEVDTEKNKSQKRPVLSKPELHTERNASKARHVKGVGKKKLSKKSKKQSPFSQQSQIHSDQNMSKLRFVNRLSETGEQKLSKKSQKRPSVPAYTESNVKPIHIENELDVEQLSSKSTKRPTLKDDLPEENSQDVFETSDIQPSNDIMVEKESQSSRNQQNANKQLLHVDGPQPKKSRRGRRRQKTRNDRVAGESAIENNHETNEVDEDQVPKRKSKSKTEPTRHDYEALKELPGTRHSTRTRRPPVQPPSISFLLEKMRLKRMNPVSSSKKRQKTASTSRALKKKGNLLDDIEEETGGEVSISPNVESSRDDVPPRKKKRPNETEHSSAKCVCSFALNDELEPLKSFEFHGVRIGTGCKSVESANLTAHYLPSFTSGRSFGCMTIHPNSTKSSSRTIDEMWMMVMSGTIDLIINNESRALETGSIAQMRISTKYQLRNNSDHPVLIFFTQDTK